MEPIDQLLKHAANEVDGQEATRALWDTRLELEQSYSNVVGYEIVLKENESWAEFLAFTIPRVTEHFSAKGLPLRGTASAILAVWRGRKMYMFDGPHFFEAIREIEGLDDGAFWIRIGEWRQDAGLTIPREAIQAAKQPVPMNRALAALAPSPQLMLGEVRVGELSEPEDQ